MNLTASPFHRAKGAPMSASAMMTRTQRAVEVRNMALNVAGRRTLPAFSINRTPATLTQGTMPILGMASWTLDTPTRTKAARTTRKALPELPRRSAGAVMRSSAGSHLGERWSRRILPHVPPAPHRIGQCGDQRDVHDEDRFAETPQWSSSQRRQTESDYRRHYRGREPRQRC